MNNKFIKYFIAIMVIKIYNLYFYQRPILRGRGPETVLMHRLNKFFVVL